MPVRSLPDLLNEVLDDTNDGLQVVGNKAHDAADGGGPVKIGGKASTAVPSAVANGDRVDTYHDEYGRVVTVAIGNIAHDAADSGNPLKVGGKAATSLPTAVANNDRVDTYHNEYGEVGVLGGGRTVIVSATITTGAPAAYTAGNAIGGKITLANAVRKSGGSGVIESIILIDDAKQAAAIDLVLFNQDFTAIGDNAAFAPSDADLENSLGYIPIAAANYSQFSDNAAATVRNVGLPFVLSGSASLYGQLVTSGTPSYNTSTDITLKVVIRQD